MTAYFDTIKLVFFFLTTLIALFQLRIKGLLSKGVIDIIGPFILPLYFIIVGIIIGYIIGYILAAKNGPENEEKSYITGFIIGGVIGIFISAIYYFTGGNSF